MANVHTLADLYEMQALPLNLKISMTMRRIRDWVNEYGEEGVYISFSGGKDSTVLLDIVRNRCGYKKIPAVFVDVPTQYPELKEFAETFDNVVIVKPKMSFYQVCEKYGFPIISKEVSETVYYAKKNLKEIANKQNIPDLFETYKLAKQNGYKLPSRTSILFGEFGHKEKGVLKEGEYSVLYDKSKYKFFLGAKFDISHKCCKELKKKPIIAYAKESGRVPMTAMMASESKLRTQSWLQNGCNSFNPNNPMSNPMSFWTEQDILLYIKQNNLPICSVYGDVVEDWDSVEDVEGQMTISDLQGFEDCGIFDAERPALKTTGCVLCGFGCHLEGEGNERFLRLKETHPKFHNLLYILKNNGVTYAEAIDWINENGNFNIRY